LPPKQQKAAVSTISFALISTAKSAIVSAETFRYFDGNIEQTVLIPPQARAIIKIEYPDSSGVNSEWSVALLSCPAVVSERPKCDKSIHDSARIIARTYFLRPAP